MVGRLEIHREPDLNNSNLELRKTRCFQLIRVELLLQFLVQRLPMH
jgi:hypothetical protein